MTLNNIVTLKFGLMVSKGHWKIPFESLGKVSYSQCIVTLKSGLEATQGHWNWCHSKAWVGFLFAFYSNYGANLYRLRDIATHW